jgi:hypothetical protein
MKGFARLAREGAPLGFAEVAGSLAPAETSGLADLGSAGKEDGTGVLRPFLGDVPDASDLNGVSRHPVHGDVRWMGGEQQLARACQLARSATVWEGR